MIRELIDDGWSLVIYPEGGRSPDGWGQEFKGGAAYLSSRTGASVVPVFIDGTGSIFGKGMKRLKPGRTRVVFGSPMRPEDDESTRRLNARIEAAVTALADERPPTSGRPAAVRPTAPTPPSAAPSTRAGAASGRCRCGAGRASLAGASHRPAAGPSSGKNPATHSRTAAG